MSPFSKKLTEEGLRQELVQFWGDALEVGQTRQGLALALPQTYPDGWQMVVDVEDHLPSGIRLTDRGRTLEWLSAQGQNIDTPAMSRHLNAICNEYELQRDGLELQRWLERGVEAVDIHVFAEALVGVAHLHVLHEPHPRTLDVPDQMLKRVFKDHRVEATARASLDGQTRKGVHVDYLVEQDHLKAFQIIRQHGRILSTMERWGFRWHDLQASHPGLMPAMIFDPHHQEIDAESRAIGEDVCTLFCSYEETDKIHQFLDLEI